MERHFQIRDAPPRERSCASWGYAEAVENPIYDDARIGFGGDPSPLPGGACVRGKLVISSHTYLAQRHKRTHVARVHANFDVRGVKNNGCGISLHSGKGRRVWGGHNFNMLLTK